MSITHSAPNRKYSDRPAPCPVCGSPSWWNGWRKVAKVIRDVDEVVRHVTDVLRHRARCSDDNCSVGSWTTYDSDSYPYRSFQLSVVFSAVSQVAFDSEATYAGVARSHLCAARSVQRWLHWVAELVCLKSLAQACARLDPDGLPPPRYEQATRRRKAASVLKLLERLAELAAHWGVHFPVAGSGLERWLLQQFARYGDVLYLTKSSPPLRLRADALLV